VLIGGRAEPSFQAVDAWLARTCNRVVSKAGGGVCEYSHAARYRRDDERRARATRIGTMDEQLPDDQPILRTIARDEAIRARARAKDAIVVVTDHRLAVASGGRLLLDVPLENVRRIQFDIERRRPATLVVVPEQPQDEPQVLAVQPDEYPRVAELLVVIGQRLASFPQ
jgi:hypothetical protein